MRLQLFTKRKKNIFLSLITLHLSLFTITKALAQEAATDQTKLGIRGGIILGMNVTQVDGDDYAGFTKIGLNTGFYGQIPVSKIFFVSTEILYSQRGSKSQVQPQGSTQLPFKFVTNYAEIPVLFHFQERRAVNFGAGVSYGRLVKQQVDVNGLVYSMDYCTGKPDITDSSAYECIKRSDYSVVADANYIPIEHLSINIRFAYSIVPFGYFGTSNFHNRGIYHNMLSFRVMWVF